MIDESTKQKGRQLRVLIIQNKAEEAKKIIDEIGASTYVDITVNPLIMSVIHKNNALVEYCLKNGGNANDSYHPNDAYISQSGDWVYKASKCRSALALACANGNVELVELLLKSGANPNAMNIADQSVIEEVFNINRSETDNSFLILRLLLQYGVDVNTKMSYNNGITFLELAKESNRTELLAEIEKFS